MTPDRMHFLIEQCFLRHRRERDEARYDNLARFLGVTPITLRRWLRGDRPIPRAVEIVMEVFHEWPEVRAERLAQIIAERDGVVSPRDDEETMA